MLRHIESDDQGTQEVDANNAVEDSSRQRELGCISGRQIRLTSPHGHAHRLSRIECLARQDGNAFDPPVREGS